MESQETHSVSEGPSRCPGSWWKTCFKQPSWVQKKMSNYPGLSRGLYWRKGNTELWRWWWSWQWAKGWPWWRTWGPQSLNHCCWIASYLCTLLSWWFHPFPNNSHMSMTPNYHHRPSPQKNGSLFSLSANQNTMPKVNHNRIESFKSMFVFSTVMFLVIAIYWIQAWSR